MLKIHRYVGLVLGAWLTLVGFSGAVLVFWKEIDQRTTPMSLVTQAGPDRPDFDQAIAHVQAAYPDRVILSYNRPNLDPRESLRFTLTKPNPKRPLGGDGESLSDLEVFVDPHTTQILGARPYHIGWRYLQSFHKELLVPGTGERVLGVLGLIVLTTAIAGIVLWWRDNKKRPARGLQIRLSSSKPRLIRDFHTVIGIYVALIIAFQATTGALVADWFQVRTFVLGFFEPPMPFAPPPAVPETRVTANQARDAALALYPDHDTTMIELPRNPGGIYNVRLFPRTADKTDHMRQALVSGLSGKVVRVFDPDQVSLPARIMNLWMIWIHNGNFFQLPGKIVILIGGLGLGTLFPTGLYIWWRKRPSRRKAPRATPAAQPS